MTRNGPLTLLFHTVFVLFMVAPLAMVVLVSFTDQAFLSLPTSWPSLRWYWAIADNPEFLRAFWISLYLGVLSASIAVALSVPAALAIARRQFPGREAISAFLLSPLLVPHVVLGVAFLRFFSEVGLSGTFIGLTLAHVLIIMPYALQLALASAYGMDASIENAATSLGARPFAVFRRITLPVMASGVAAGWILAFLHSFDELTMTVFIAAPGTTTLPVRLYLHIEETIDPLVASVSALLIFGALLLMGILEKLYGVDRILIGKGR